MQNCSGVINNSLSELGLEPVEQILMSVLGISVFPIDLYLMGRSQN